MVETEESIEIAFSEKRVKYFFNHPLSALHQLTDPLNTVVITDDNLVSLHPELRNHQLIVIPAGEQHKQQVTVDDIISQLINFEATRQTWVVGVGGGVVTDIAGYAASVYMRGLRYGFVPTTVLAQVDAAIGGKNGIDAGLYKNIIGVIRQPEFILFDHELLQTLPDEQWINGFAEIIKHAAIADAEMFEMLEAHTLQDYRTNPALLAELIQRNALLKSDFVQRDEFEKGDRKKLNFGHTLGHAVENLYSLPHGFAVSIGMVAAASLSMRRTGFPQSDYDRLIAVLKGYGLPVDLEADGTEVMKLLKMDKKRVSDQISVILLNRIGESVIQPIPVTELEAFCTETFNS
jgi:3-dehydroquinate synthase